MADNKEIKGLTMAEVGTLASHFTLIAGSLRATNPELNAAFERSILSEEREVLAKSPLAFHKPKAIAAAEVTAKVLLRAGGTATLLTAWNTALEANGNVVKAGYDAAEALFKQAHAPTMATLCAAT